jgi:RHH-type proline utilization regulon transcriptional repressor/proline dehydrogenase/delta 1-pyrroline-5-carboxylate dehydrogenase
MNIMGRQFVLGRTIEEARKRGREMAAKGYRYSYDMLGEGARTDADAQRYFASYAHAIEVAGNESARGGVIEAPGISVKLTALHPRFEIGQMDRVHSELLPRARRLALMAKERNMGFNIDAEEAERLEPTLDVLEALAADPELAGWDGLGIAIQAYQKRALPVVDWLADLGRRTHRRLMVRLVKGAYWDTEIKLAQD